MNDVIAGMVQTFTRCDRDKGGCGRVVRRRLIPEGRRGLGIDELVCPHCRKRVWIQDRDGAVFRIDRGRAPKAGA